MNTVPCRIVFIDYIEYDEEWGGKDEDKKKREREKTAMRRGTLDFLSKKNWRSCNRNLVSQSIKLFSPILPCSV
jgi:hypothetical protein